jgi:hypothetical protein
MSFLAAFGELVNNLLIDLILCVQEANEVRIGHRLSGNNKNSEVWRQTRAPPQIRRRF